jgi:hypothetical protein
MKGFNHFYAKTRLASLALTLSLCLGPAPRAQLLHGLTQTTQDLTQTTQDLTQSALKVSPDLLQLVGSLLSNSRVPVIVQANGPSGSTLDLLLLTLGAGDGVIADGGGGVAGDALLHGDDTECMEPQADGGKDY